MMQASGYSCTYDDAATDAKELASSAGVSGTSFSACARYWFILLLVAALHQRVNCT